MNEEEKRKNYVREIASVVKIYKEGDLISIHRRDLFTAIIGQYINYELNNINVEGNLVYLDENGTNQIISLELIESVKRANRLQ
ncbi:hypothetical protein [Leptospira interrogans]|uniref:Uncharacterized protein n=1 Tax=Leptospira interrogans serovar Canicola TaxID=211880 RepID=A0AAP9WBP8_LEPIR|nr:hypothetical protein [Leptospira interrogans]QOI43020.1 hypothetical protein Lepto782_12640 [Leptospira interrogans serovar Canicola]